MQTEFKYLPIQNIQAGQYQPRQNFDPTSLKELAQSIATQGLIEPLIVRPVAQSQYELIAGERRWRAAQQVGLSEVPCLIGRYSDKQACTMSLVENIQRDNLNPLEEATAYRRLINEFHYQQNEIAILVGKSRSHIANILRLQNLCPQVKNLVLTQQLSFGQARVLVGLNDAQQEYFSQLTIEQQWSVRQLEQMVQQQKKSTISSSSSSLKNTKKDRDVERLQNFLAEQLGAPVQIINDAENGGWLQVKFFDNDTLAGLLERFGLSYD